MKKTISFSILSFALSFFCFVKDVAGGDTTLVKSPGGNIVFKLFPMANGMAYSIYFNGKPVIEPSLFSMTIDRSLITKDYTINKIDRYNVNNTYQWRGAHSAALNQYNGAKIILNKNEDAIEIRVFKDAAAFRFIIPGRQNINRISDETTVFNIPSKSTLWYHDLYMYYESVHINPDTLLATPAVEIIKSIPATWDETIVLPPSEIGEIAVYARRKGDMWFLAIMNGVGERKIKIPLHFLKGNYKVLIAKDDADNPAAIVMEHANYSTKDTIELNLVSGGGFIARFSK